MLRVNGFLGHTQRNNLRSAAMFLGFAIACQLIGIAMLVGPLMLVDLAHAPVFDFARYVERYSIVVFAISAGLFLVRYYWHVNSIQKIVHFERITQTQEPRLYKTIEIQAIAAGIAMPDIGIIEDEARNAFACGMSEHSAVVVVTRGLLRALDDNELEAVVAHEISHIVNGDIRLMAVVNVLLTSFFLIIRVNPFQFSNLKYLSIIFVFYIGINTYLSGPSLDIWIILGVPFLFIMFIMFIALVIISGFATRIGMTLAKLSRLLISSSREFIADAEAVRMTKNPAALISALKRIEGRSEIDGLDEAIDAMMIDGAVEGAYASHPTIADRIAILAQHAGAMVHSTGSRKDTRNYGEFAISTSGHFGQRQETFKHKSKKPKRLLIARVNAGSGENVFGLRPMARNMVITGVLIIIVFWQQVSRMQTEAMLGPRILSIAPVSSSVFSMRPMPPAVSVSPGYNRKYLKKHKSRKLLKKKKYQKTISKPVATNPQKPARFAKANNVKAVFTAKSLPPSTLRGSN